MSKRSKDTKAAHLNTAKRWLALGHAPIAVATRLQRKYGMSRAQTHRDVQMAEAELDAENIQLAIDTELAPMLEQRDAMLRDIEQNWMEASEQHNPKEMEQLSRAYERLWRMGGHQSQIN